MNAALAFGQSLYAVAREVIVKQLRDEGWSVLPPGNVSAPRSRDDAVMMKVIGEAYLKADTLTAIVAEKQERPLVSGVGRDATYERSVIIYCSKRPTDDEMRAIHDAARAA